jgi:hypothetical protein
MSKSKYHGHDLAVYLHGFADGYIQGYKDWALLTPPPFDPTGQIAASRMARAKQDGMLKEPFIDSDEFEPTAKGPAIPDDRVT